MTVGFNTPFPRISNTKFIVRNIAPGNKTVKVFNYPILNGMIRDLMGIPEVSEADIRHSLLKGELAIKFTYKELEVVDSDIDLIQFNAQQKALLQSFGIVNGLNGGGGQPDIFTNVTLIGPINGINQTFTIPEKVIINANFAATVYLNGVRQTDGQDFYFAESGGIGTGYDTVFFNTAPEVGDILVIDYTPVATP